jgi:hypothetical protein
VVTPSSTLKAASTSNEELSATVPLVRIAWGRSGDKGDTSNIGIIARRPDFLPLIRDQVNEKSVAEYFRHFAKGKVRRFDLPGFDALNFTLEHALDGGGIASMRTDPLGKCFAQILLSMPVRVPRKVAQELGS